MMKKRLPVLLLAVAAMSGAVAAELPAAVEINRNGSLKIGSAELKIRCFIGEKWVMPPLKMDASTIGRHGGEAAGGMQFEEQTIRITQKLQPLSADSFRFTVDADFSKPLAVKVFCASLELPTGTGPFDVTVDGVKLDLPEKFVDKPIPGADSAKLLVAKLPGGTTIRIAGNFRVAVQDGRKFKGGDRMALRLYGTPGFGTIRNSSINLNITVDTVKSVPVDLAESVNLGFADDVADDGRGGWSDQGPTNDLRAFTLRKVRVENIGFDIIDPARNNGKSAIVMGRTVDKSPVSVPLPPDSRARSLVLLHASCWTPSSQQPLGWIDVTFADGSVQKIPVSLQEDSGNWWGPMPRKNAAVAWKHQNNSAAIGLYAAPFELRRDDPRTLRFRLNTAPGHENAMWMIAGVSLADRPFRFTCYANDVQFTAGAEWRPLEFGRTLVPGSPLDFSRYVEAPAGKYGAITARPDGTLAFKKAPDKRIRLFGVNLAFSANYLEKEEADQLAARLRMLGYNSVRIHHHDNALVDPAANDSLTLDPAQLDKLDYLICAMARNGLYVTSDFYTNRLFKPGDNIPECKVYDEPQMKALLPVSRAAMENWKAFSRKLMEHRNPYTGKLWKEDPALYAFNLVNEEVLSISWRTAGMSGVYLEKYDRWARKKGIGKSERHFRRFLNELQDQVIEEQLRFLREEVKVKPLLTSLNHVPAVNLTELRHRFDLVDSHGYHDHPSFPVTAWRLPNAYQQRSAIQAKAPLPRNIMPDRIFGKPFIVTEFCYVNPNIHRAEGGPLIGGYAALQDWDALYRFAWSHSRDSVIKLNIPTVFDGANDPLAQLSDRISMMLFRRGDVKAARQRYACAIPENFFDTEEPFDFPPAFSELGLIARIGSVHADKPVPEGVIRLNLPACADPAALADKAVARLWRNSLKTGAAVSTTGQLALNARTTTFAVRTPRAESLTLPKGELAGDWMTVRNASTFQTVAALSLDDLPLAESRSILLLQLTDLGNTGAVFGNRELTLQRSHGRLPLLLRRGSATVEIRSAVPFKVTALKTDGSPAGEIGGTLRDGRFLFKADTANFPCGVMAMHLTR